MSKPTDVGRIFGSWCFWFDITLSLALNLAPHLLGGRQALSPASLPSTTRMGGCLHFRRCEEDACDGAIGFVWVVALFFWLRSRIARWMLSGGRSSMDEGGGFGLIKSR
ncbi:hypothetical protein Bca101_065358 [Brassica carinata]